MTSLEKRQRHKQGHRSRMEEARIAAAKARRRNAVVRVLVAVLVVGVAVAAVVLLLQEDPPADELVDGSTTTVDETLPDDGSTEPQGTPVELPPGPEGRTLEGETPCPAADGSEERVAVFAQAPPTCIDPARTYEADVEITRGEGDSAEVLGTVTIALDTAAAPETVNNFVVLSRYGFYDGIPFHRLVPGFVAQVGGAGTPGVDGAPDYGTTGPGYDSVDAEYPTDGYQPGDVAMARSATVSGSQFFIVTGADSLSALDQAANYPRFGRVTAGLELAQQMTEDSAGELPTVLYTISDITIREA